MEFEWDNTKDAINIAKHGVSLADAALLDWQIGTTIPDDRIDYGEVRNTRYALLGKRLHVCLFTFRNNRHRIISLRKANKREILAHGKK